MSTQRESGYTYDDLVTLTAWMAENGYDANAVAYAVEKPHKHEEELARAWHETHNEGHVTVAGDSVASINATCQQCDWTDEL